MTLKELANGAVTTLELLGFQRVKCNSVLSTHQNKRFNKILAVTIDGFIIAELFDDNGTFFYQMGKKDIFNKVEPCQKILKPFFERKGARMKGQSIIIS